MHNTTWNMQMNGEIITLYETIVSISHSTARQEYNTQIKQDLENAKYPEPVPPLLLTPFSLPSNVSYKYNELTNDPRYPRYN